MPEQPIATVLPVPAEPADPLDAAERALIAAADALKFGKLASAGQFLDRARVFLKIARGRQ